MARGDNWPNVLTITNVKDEIIERFQSLCDRRGVDPATQFETMVRSFDRGTQKYDLEMRLDFGKYSGMLVEDVVRTDPRYLNWLVNTSEWFRLSAGALDLLEEMSH